MRKQEEYMIAQGKVYEKTGGIYEKRVLTYERTE